MARVLRCLFFAALATLCSFVVAGPAHADTPAHGARFAAGHEMLRIINADRVANGLRPLSFDTSEAVVARQHSRDMAAHHYFSHTSLAGQSPFDRLHRAGISYHIAGENLGMDSGASRHAMLSAIEVAMLHSPEHRANLLRSTFTQVGIGIAVSGSWIYVTEDFTG